MLKKWWCSHMFNEKTLEIMDNMKKDIDNAINNLNMQSVDSLEKGIKEFEQHILEIQEEVLKTIVDSDCSEEEKTKIMNYITNPNFRSENLDGFKEGNKDNLPDD